MNKSKTNVTFVIFFKNIYYYEELIDKIIMAKKVIWNKSYKKEIIEALSIKVLTEWESFIKNLLIDCFNKDTSKYSNYMWKSLPKHLTRNTCFCILSWLWFFDIKWMNEVKNLSKKIIIDKYNPFLLKSENVKDYYSNIDDFYIFRNYITHQSQKSYNSYKNLLKEKYKYKRAPDIWNLFLSKWKNWKYIINDYINNFNELAYELLVFAKDNSIISEKEFKKSMKINWDEIVLLK